jgi:predicted NBD/HSP70 family sugar kinase
MTHHEGGVGAWPFVGPGVLLRLIRDGGASTRADLCRRTGLSRSAVDERLLPLVECGLVHEWTTRNWTVRRPPSTLGFNDGAGIVLAADLAPRRPRLAAADLGGRIVVEEATALGVGGDPGQALGAVRARFEQILRDAGRAPRDLRGIAVGLPSPLPDPGWESFSVTGWLADRFSVPAIVEEGVNLMALGEQRGHWSDCDPFMLVCAGDGFSCGLISGGRLHRGPQGTSGGIGHVRVAGHDGVVCVCGNNGCLDAVAGGKALAALLGAEGVDDVVARVRGGDAGATRLVRSAGRSLGQVVAGCVNLLNPGAVVIGGELAEIHEPLLAGVREVVFQESLPLATRSLRIAPSRLGERAGLTGAVSCLLDHVLAPEAIDRSLAPAGRGFPTVSAVL